MKSAFVLALTGPAGSGKSTIAGKLAKEIEQCVNIDVDHVKHMIVSGFIYDKTPKGVRQWELLGDNIGLLAKNFQNAEYNVIINGYINEPAWHNIQKHVTLTHKVLLLPHVDTIIQRDAGRDEDVRMGNEAINVHHDYFSSSEFYRDFTKLDTTEHTIEETVEELKGMLAL